jgi:hypothetical protein
MKTLKRLFYKLIRKNDCRTCAKGRPDPYYANHYICIPANRLKGDMADVRAYCGGWEVR